MSPTWLRRANPPTAVGTNKQPGLGTDSGGIRREGVMLTRRQLLQRGAIGGAGLVVSHASFATAAPPVVGGTPRLRRWVEALPVPPVLDGRGGGKTFAIAARESTTWKFHPNLPATRTWGYWSDNPQAGLPYLGPTIEATRRPNDNVETSVTIEWGNELGDAFLPNDPTLMGAVMPGQPAPIIVGSLGRNAAPSSLRHSIVTDV